MCGRYTLRTPLNVLLAQFGAELQMQFDFRPRYNIAPTQSVLVVRQPEQRAKRELVALRWGLIPVWAKDTEIGYSTINARGDTVAEKPAFRAASKSVLHASRRGARRRWFYTVTVNHGRTVASADNTSEE